MEYAEFVHENVQRVQERIAEAALRAGRDPAAVTLVAVTKTFPVEAILAGWAAGLRHFGENRPEEGAEKVPQVNAAIEGVRPTWHMVGHVQSRKAALTVAHFDVVHSVDRPKIARRLSRFAREAGRQIPILLECNISGEPTKYGFRVDRWQEDQAQREAFFAACAEVLPLPALQVKGLMTMAPIVEDPETVRPIFAGLRALQDALAERFPDADWRELSMGMTDDFEVAVEEGATMVRIGRALFGPRVPHSPSHPVTQLPNHRGQVR
ncbi:MAG TPA: YggS family pyridoxal phosphate-dependent enzyme [Anaerolineales bacterium]|nr:YggS family pyridoxal phosphate-dependent enzyme [Anaerolineae bacterium]HIQ02479.1 YggS family pyridoxal phosphate-dependent enzyme [Anaerolineales bacterium]